MKKAVAYLRVSGRNQVNGYGLDRQEEIANKFALNNAYELKAVYKEEGISGTTEEHERPAFQKMIIGVLKDNIDTVIIESMDRLARELRIQENLCVYLASKGIQLISANTGENITKAIEDDPMKKALIQIQGVFAELDKNQIVRKLRNGREKARENNYRSRISLSLNGNGKCEGRKSYKETNPELIKLAQKLYRKPKNKKRRSLAKISFELHKLGFGTSQGKSFSASQIRRLLIR